MPYLNVPDGTEATNISQAETKDIMQEVISARTMAVRKSQRARAWEQRFVDPTKLIGRELARG